EKRARKVDADDAVPFLERGLGHWAREPDAGVIYEHVEPAKALPNRGKERAHVVLARDVRTPGKLALRVEVADRDRGAFVAKRLRDCASDAAPGTRDERHLVCEPHVRSPRAERASIATHAACTLVFRLRLAVRLHRPAPAEGAARRSPDRIPAGPVRGIARSLGTERTCRDQLEAPLHLPLVQLVGAAARDPVPVSGRPSVQSAA